MKERNALDPTKMKLHVKLMESGLNGYPLDLAKLMEREKEREHAVNQHL